MKRLPWLCVAVVVSACSSGSTCVDGMPSGIPDKRPCGDLSYLGNFGEFDAQCDATVDDTENCYEARTKDPCHYDFNASCGALYVCLLYLRIE
jgi:hypothetical protein